MRLDQIAPRTTRDVLERAATVVPDLEAVVTPTDRVDFKTLHDRAVAVARGLVAAGIGPGDHVGICLGNGPRWAELFFGITRLGAVAVPINTRFRPDELAYALRQSRCRLLFMADRFLRVDFVDMLCTIDPTIGDHERQASQSSLPDLEQVVVVGQRVPAAATSFSRFEAAGQEIDSDVPLVDPRATALIQYTSGTTAFPKGVLLSHESLCLNAFVSGSRMGLRAGDRFHSARPFFHVAGTTLSLLSSAQLLTTLVTMDRFEGAAALDLMVSERCTHFSGNDTIALMLLGEQRQAPRALCLRGAWLAASPTVVARVVEELGARECVVGYGLSEAAPNVAQSAWWEPLQLRISGSMPAQPGVEVRIVEATTGDLLADGQRGEILVRGWSVMKGYFDQPDETAAVLRDGWLHTGDLGRLAGGRLEFLGRVKETIRVGGENVSPAEVEDALHRHPLIRQAVVVGVPDARLVEVPFAFVLLHARASLEPQDVIGWAREVMAGYKVPRHVVFVSDFESIGLTASGKVTKTTAAAKALKHLESAGTS